MMSNLRLLPVILFATMFATAVTARTNTAMEAFIGRMKTTNNFVPVSNLWVPDNNFDKTELLKNVEEAQPLTIDYGRIATFMSAKSTAIDLIVPGVNGGTYTIELGRYDFFSNDFQVHAKGEGDADRLVDYTPGLYYRGVVKGYPGSVAAFSFFNNEVYGVFSIPDEGNYVLVPNSMTGKEYDYNPNYILYNDVKLKIKDQAPGCATDQLPEQYGNNLAAKTTTFLNNKVYNSCTEVQVYEVADYDTYVKKGSSVTNVTNFMTALFNNQSTVYRNEGVPIVLKYLQINEASDIYMTITSALSIRFLKKFGWQTKNVMHGCDLALLASTRFGSLGGVAWLKAMCNSYASDSSGPYGYANISNSGIANFPTYSWNLMVLCHEMGHIVGSPHTHRCCWNPPGSGTTAIDGCQTLEGSCPMPSPAYPSGGGTIMSYCHLQSVGINMSKGFGPQPGDTIRRQIRNKFSSSCGGTYTPNTALSTKNRTITANRECTNIVSGDTTTYYWYDKNTADHADDTLVLMVKKHGNNIGTLDSAGFSVITGSSPMYATGSADTFAFPGGTTGATAIGLAMRRYWKITTTANATSPVSVYFPYTAADTADVDGSVSGAMPVSKLKMYKVNSPVNPDPAKDSLMYYPASNVTVFDYGSTASTTSWAPVAIGGTMFASVKMTNLSGGGSLFYPSNIVGVRDVNNASITRIYPNPTNDAWNVVIEGSAGAQQVEISIYAADGRMVLSQVLSTGTVNTIKASHLAAGMYFYRIVGGKSVFTGTLTKE
jgi:hypothetical protein